jgi:hypothetical protein
MKVAMALGHDVAGVSNGLQKLPIPGVQRRLFTLGGSGEQ